MIRSLFFCLSFTTSPCLRCPRSGGFYVGLTATTCTALPSFLRRLFLFCRRRIARLLTALILWSTTGSTLGRWHGIGGRADRIDECSPAASRLADGRCRRKHVAFDQRERAWPTSTLTSARRCRSSAPGCQPISGSRPSIWPSTTCRRSHTIAFTTPTHFLFNASWRRRDQCRL